MALTKASAALVSSQSVPAGTSVNGSLNLNSVYGGEILWKITNGGSAPTTVPTIEIQASDDNVNWYRIALVTGDLTASSINSSFVPCPVARMYVKAICTAGATNASTMAVMMEQTTAY